MKALARMIGRRRQPAGPPSLPPGYRLYAVGDVHGRDDLLGELLDSIHRDDAARAPARTVLVFLGDLIDRGPSSAEVVERLRAYRPKGTRAVFLAGNHEEVLLRILDGEAALIPDWLRFGGKQCLRSYGLDPARLRGMQPRRAVEAVRAALPAAHVEFLRGFDDSFSAGDYLFVHAGIRPGIPLSEQARADLRWIREPFLSDSCDHGCVVVHGHTIRAQVEERGNRIGIDTGAYRTGTLTALAIEGKDRWYLHASEPEAGDGTAEWNPAEASALDGVSSQSG
jgi:serine/threonine protein phosphatase 1